MATPADRCIHHLFEAQAAQRPGAPAISSAAGIVTYQELNNRANRLAHALQAMGVGPEVLVGLYLPRSVELIMAMLATLKAGGAYVPLDPVYPTQRLAYMCAASGLQVLLTTRALAPTLDAGSAIVYCLDEERFASDAKQPTANPGRNVNPQNPAYVIYTSGSTGRPKGVLIEHRGLCNLVTAQQAAFGIDSQSRVLQFASASFDAAVAEIFGALTVGATLCLVEQPTLLPGPALIRLLQEQEISVATLPPSVLAAMADAPLPALQTLVSAGEPCPAQVVQRWAPGRRFFNAYGPTEVTVCATVARCWPNGGTPSIGEPLPGVQVHLLNGDLHLIQAGESGELCVGGIGLARGYVNQPALTAERFVPDPSASRPGARLYRTGDLARLRPDGSLEYLGRADQQVKLRGFRVELGEIEAALGLHPRLRAAAVTLGKSQPEREGVDLLAYLVAGPEPAPSARELRAFLADMLPAYMLPTLFIYVPELPLTPNGKIDRGALPAPDIDRFEAAEPYVAPRTPTEQLLADVWAEVLGVERVGVYDSFFDLGGHSLRATQVLTRLSALFGREILPATLFAAPTVAGLAQTLERDEHPAQAMDDPPIVHVPRDGPAPVSFSQERVWFLLELAPSSLAYQAQAVIRWIGRFDHSALEQSLSEMLRRHEILRTRFPAIDGVPMQVVQEPQPVVLPVVDLQRFDSWAEREAEAKRLIAAAMARPLDVTIEPPIRWLLLRLSPREHLLLQVEHHFVHDGWSFGLLMRELLALYGAYVAGQPSPLAALPLQYADFAMWQRRWMQGEGAAQQLAYWQAQLARVPAVLELPLDRPRPPVQRFIGAARRIVLPLDLSEATRRFGRSEGATLFMTMLAAFMALLSRYSRQEEFCVGTGIANRRWRETEGLIGMIVNTVALCADLTGAPTFRELLSRVRTTTLGAYAHQDLPFDRVVDALRLVRSPSMNPLYQVLFSFHDSAMPDLALPDLQLSVQEALNNGSAKFDLNVIVIPRREQMTGESRARAAGEIEMIWEYSTDLFESESIERMIEHYQSLLRGAIAQPERPVAELPLAPVPLSYDPPVALLAERPSAVLHEWFAQQVMQTPNAVAVVCGSIWLTYDEVNRRANRLAYHLRGCGIGPERLVGLFLERSVELVVAILATLKAGGAYVPLDPSYPAERLAYILDDAHLSVLLTMQHVAERLPRHAAMVIRLDADWGAIAPHSAEELPNLTHPSNLAYVIYTSGSTGQPKGVQVSHGNVVRLFVSTWERFRFERSDVWTMFHSYAFDFSVWEMWGALLYGGRLVVVPYAVSRDPAAFLALLCQERVTVLNQTPSAFRQLAAQVLQAPAELPDAGAALALRLVIFGGEALDLQSLRPWYERFGDERPQLVNMYGITETTVHVTYCRLRGADLWCAAGSLIGTPMADLIIYVLDDYLQPVPAGVPGEIYVGGAGLARGYLHRPELTAERFLPNPYGFVLGSTSTPAGQRLYRTGDLARYRPDGELEYLGRVDQQVKIRGFRIELGEIEAALGAHPSVQAAVVTVQRGWWSDGADEEGRLVAYLVPQPAVQVDTADLRAFLQARLPSFMLPAAFVLIEHLPLTPSGKVDRRALPAPHQAQMRDERQMLPPTTPAQAALVAIFAQVLGLPSLSIDDNFFDLGGHSLLATRALARIRAAFAVELPLAVFFGAPTVADLASAVERLRGAAGGWQSAPIVAIERSEPLPLSFAQQRLWFLAQLLPESPFYHIPICYQLTGYLDEEALAAALQALVQRHESLRTRFVLEGQQPVQVVVPEMRVTLERLDLSALPAQARTAEAQRIATAEVRRPFDLQQGPLLRATLLRLQAQERLLVLVVHHICFDGWSAAHFWDELALHYAAQRRGQPLLLPPLPVQYADVAHWQRQCLTSMMAEQLPYWRERLGGQLPVLELPTDRPRPAVQTYRGAKYAFAITGDLTAALRTLSRTEGATLFMTLLAVYKLLLSRYTGQRDLLVGSPVANRTRPETHGMIGLLINTLVLRTDLAAVVSFRDLLQRVKETALGAYAHQELPFERLVEELQPERHLSHQPLFQTIFTLQPAAPAPQLSGLQVEPVLIDQGTAQCDLIMGLEERADGLAGLVQFSTDLFDRETIQRFCAHFVRLLEEVVADPTRTVWNLPLLSVAEEAQLAAWSDGGEPVAPQQRIDELFAQQAARTPEAVALRYGEQRLSYAELNRLAHRLAQRLRRCGVGPDVLVAVLAVRSPEAIIGLLAVLKAGGAYLPLDPTYPQERLAYMLRETAAPVLLAQVEFLAHLPTHGAQVISLDGSAAAGASAADGDDDAPLPHDTSEENLAYVIYTSGSTGRPRGVGVPHRAVVRLVHQNRFARLDPHEIFLQLAPLSFDAATFEIWGALLNGATLALMPPGSASPQEIGEAIRRAGVTTLWLTAGLFHLMVEEQIDALRPLHQLLAGGDALSAAHVRRFIQEAPGCALINGYGPTENTTFTSTHRFTAADATAGLVPIGRPIGGTSVYILDHALQPVPVGVTGELYTGGAGLARGYIDQPDLTAERFVPNPFAPGRLYRTGDRVRYLADGSMQFLGRIDQQVKMRGHRIEPGEVEEALLQHPLVQQAVVVAQPDGAGDRRLVAYVVPAANADLRSFLAAKLPAYMIPAAFVPLAALPLTTNGKVDRQALPAPVWTRASEQPAHALPRSPMEEVVALIWGEVLGCEQILADDDFFALGGHSLLAARVVSRIGAALGVTVPFRQIFQTPTLGTLTEWLQREVLSGRQVDHIPIARRRDSSSAPLSYGQQRLWVIHQMEPESAAYHIFGAFRVMGALQCDALQAALSAVVQRHEALRTTIGMQDGQPIQMIAPPTPAALPLTDLCDLPADAREREALRLAHAEASQPFDLTRGPLLRAGLVRLAPAEHLLLLTMHHLVADGWSIDLLFGEIAERYGAFCTGSAPPLPELPLQYADFAIWQRQQDVREQLAYWQAQLAGVPQLLTLPTDFPRPAVQSWRGADEYVRLSAALTQALQARARQEGVTLYMLLLATWATLLYRYSGQQQMLIGSPIAGRDRLELEGLIGFFVNTLVIKADLSGNPTVRALLARVREAALGAYLHQDLPFEALVSAMQPERHASHTPLFQTMCTLAPTSARAFALPGLDVQPVRVANETAMFDLTLALTLESEGLHGTLNYNADLFRAATIRQMGDHLQRLLMAVAAAPEQRIASLPLLSAAEEAQLVAWGMGGEPAPPGPFAHEWVCLRAAQAPDALAVADGATRLTYGELERRANMLAHRLRRCGVGPERVVAVYMARSAEMLVGLLAVLKAGGAYLPIDVPTPAERIAWMLEDAAVPVLLTQERLLAQLPVHQAATICLDRDWPLLRAEPFTDPGVLIDGQTLAYLIYTSGSTGRPKGVQVAHGALRNLICAHHQLFRLTAADRTTLLSGLGFDAAVGEIWPALAAGASLHLPAEDTRLQPERLQAWLIEQAITVSCVPTPLAEVMLALPWPAEVPLRIMLTGGDRLNRYPAPHLSFALYNMYGPTENTVDATGSKVLACADAQIPPSIGRPIAGVRLLICDDQMQPVPQGVYGELLIGGASLARGYLGRPDLTAERFVPDPRTPGERLYKTGDMVRYLPDGQIEFLGRVDQQVKVRGVRVELGEIEATLMRHPAVQEAVAAVREEANGHRRLIAYVVEAPHPSGTAPLAAQPLRDFLAERLPAYLIPHAFVMLDRLPLTANGKVDRQALPAPAIASAGALAGDAAPHQPAQEQLAIIWRELLGLDAVSIHDNFFTLGGDSIISIQMVARAAQVGLRLTPRQVFQAPTIAALAGLAEPVAATLAVPEEEVAARTIPLTPIQQLFFAWPTPDPHHFNQAVSVEIEPGFSPAQLRSAMAALTAHHDALRLQYRLGSEAGVVQEVVAQVDADVVMFCQLAHLSTAEQLQAMAAQAAALQRSLTLTQAPLLRACYFDLGAERAGRLLLVIHHLAVDVYSWRLLLADLQMACAQLRQGQPIVLPPKSTSFGRWAERLAAYARTEEVRDELAYWLAEPRRYVQPLPVDALAPLSTVGEAGMVRVVLGAVETRALLQEANAAYQTQSQELLLAALAVAIGRWVAERCAPAVSQSGYGLTLVDLEGHGREEILAGVDLARTVGWFTTLFPVLFDLREAKGPGEVIMAVKEQLRAVPQRGIRYGLLRYLSGDDRIRAALEAMPQAEVLFNYLGHADHMRAPDDAAHAGALGPMQSERGPLSYPVEINGGIYGEQLELTFTYSPSRYERASVERLAAGYIDALQELLAHALAPDAWGYTPSDFPLARLDQRAIAHLTAALAAATGHPVGRNIEEVYPLTPLQQGMLFHTLMAPGAGLYVVQVLYLLEGALDVEALAYAWQRVVDRHGALRAAFVWHGLDQPLQAVLRQVPVELQQHNWSDLTAAEQQERLDALTAQDRARGFDPAVAPLTRLQLMQLDPARHWLLLTQHHLIVDGWSQPLILSEVQRLYAAYRSGQEARLGVSPPYSRYIAWLQQQDLAAAERYWRERLASFTTPTPLPLARPAAAPVGAPGDEMAVQTYSLRLSIELTERLRELGRQHSLTLNTVMQGAWALLLSRHSGETDVLFGVTLAGRPADLPGVESMVGLFINTLPMRVRVDESLPLAPWLQQIQAQQAAMQQYAHSPLVAVQRQGAQGAGRTLFETFLAFENYPIDAQHHEQRGGLRMRGIAASEQTNYPLALAIGPGPALHIQFVYHRQRFSPAAIERLAAHLHRLLAAMAAHLAEQPIAALPMLTPGEEQALAGFNATERPYDLSRCMHTVIETQVEQTPDATAVIFEGQHMSYDELNRRANRLAHYLQGKGIEPDTLVAVCADRSFEVVIALLAVLKAGGAYVPIDPAYPPERIAYMLSDTAAPVLLTQRHLVAELPKGAATVICLDDDQAEWARADGCEENPTSGVGPHHLAYVIYTSGSTGRPKGAMNEHRHICNRIWGMQERFALQPGDRVVQNTAFSFDVSVWEFFWPLMVGATLLMERPGGHQDTRYLIDLIRRERGTTLHFVPVMLQAFLQEEGVEGCSSLKHVLSGGEGVTYELQRRFYEKLGHTPATLYHLYGPTETAVAVTCWECEREVAEQVVPIGGPVENTQIYALDAHLRQTPIGVAGELYIGGAQTGRGYWQRPELTAERFIPDPFLATPGGRLYRTGDLGRYLPNGALEFLGRIDHQVKIRGFRIELGEVEAALLSHPAVRDAVVLAREERQGGGTRRLVGYVVARAGEALSPPSLRDYLQERLPHYMVPGAFMILDALPLNPNGKVDRRALPEPEGDRTGAREPYLPPRTLLELRLQQAWEEVLQIPMIGMRDNFFELGGHSLQAVALMSRMRQIAGRDLALASLFQDGTIERMAARIEQTSDGREEWTPLVPIQPKGSRPPLFLVHPVGGNVLCYADLARSLGAEQPVYGLQARGLQGEQAPYERVEEMAAAYIEALRRVQPAGPYLLGAWSLGAYVVHEMSRQLAAQGEAVELALFIDPTPLPAPAALRELAGDEAEMQRAFAADWQSQGGEPLADVAGLPLYHVFRANVRAAVRYEPAPVAGRALVVWAAAADAAQRMDWSAWVQGEVVAHEVEGDHFSVVRSGAVAACWLDVSGAAR